MNNPPSDSCPINKGESGIFSVKLSVPTGKLVIANDLRSFTNRLDESERYIREQSVNRSPVNSALGRRLNSEYWAQDHRLIMLQCDNTSPNIYYNPATHVINFKNGWRIDPNTKEDVGTVEPNEMNIGSVCTNLWAISAMDSLQFERYCQARGLNVDTVLQSIGATVVDIPAGDYEAVSYFDDEQKFSENHFAQIRPVSATIKEAP